MDSNTVYVDAANNRVGIGSTAPSYLLDLLGSAPRVRVKDSSTGAAFGHFENNSGNFYIGTDNSTGGSLSAGNYARIIWSQGAYPLVFATNDTQRAQIDSSGRLLVGTSSARGNFFNSTDTALVQVEGANNNAQRYAGHIYGVAGAGGPWHIFAKHRSNSIGGTTVVIADDQVGALSFQGSDGTEFVEAARIEALVDGTPGSNDMPGRLVFSTTADGASSPTERMRIASSGLVSTEGNLQCKGRLYWSSGADSSSLSTSSIGAATTTVYIGNAAIQVSSDVRLKENIVNTVVDATKELKKVRVVDFTWNDPTDSSFNNRNARGVWTGLIAQELVEVFPFAVNAPRKEKDLSIDYGDEAIWTVDQNQLVPVLIKAFQQQQERIETLEAKVAAFEAS
jgi:hypothetical protein